MYDLTSPGFFADPSPTLTRMREEDPLHFHEPLRAWILTRYDDVFHVLRDSRFSVDRNGAISRCPVPSVQRELDECNSAFGEWMVFSDPPRHARLRDRVASSFTPARVRSLEPAIRQIAHEMAVAARAKGEIDLIAELATPLPARVTAALIGITLEDVSTLSSDTDEVFAFFGAGIASAEVVTAAHASLGRMRAYFEGLLASRRARPGADLLSWVVEAESLEPTLERDELVGLAMTLVAGAFGTTSHLIGHAVLAMVEHREWEALVADRSLARGVVEETLRYDGPALAVQRRAREDVELRGHVIHRGERVYCMLSAANRDPRVFECPDVFDPRRSPNKHLGLGGGTHFCLGAGLARLEASIALEVLAEEVPALRLAGAPRRAGNMAMRGLASLPVATR